METSRFGRAGLWVSGLLVVLASASPARAQTAEATPTEVATRFYDAFCKGDMDSMEKLYSPDVKWKDTIFSFDDRAGTMGMWRSLGGLTTDTKFSYKIVSAKGDTVVVNWLADYKLNGRPIHNDVMATLVVKGGLIVKHDDVYPWKNWARQAFPLGPASNWFPVKQLLIGGLNLLIKAKIALAPAPSPTRGLGGALGAAAR